MQHMQLWALCLMLVSWYSSCQSPTPIDIWERHLQTQLDSLVRDSTMGGISLVAIRGNNSLILHGGTLKEGVPPNDTSLYEIASLTKTFTGTLIARAIAEGKLQLDADIRPYLTGDFPNLAYENQPITFRHLLTHESGLPHMFPDQPALFEQADWNTLPFKLNELQQGYSREAFFEELAQFRLDTLPGSRFTYSNAGANLLGYLLEDIYQKPYPQILAEIITTPLKMSDTHLALDDHIRRQLVKGYNDAGLEMPLLARKDMQAEGGIVSSPKDMEKYMRYHLDTSLVEIGLSHQELWGGKFGDFEAGFFWQIFKDGPNPDQIFQNGGAFGTSSWLSLIPSTQKAVFMITNRSGPDIHQKLSEAANRMLDDPSAN